MGTKLIIRELSSIPWKRVAVVSTLVFYTVSMKWLRTPVPNLLRAENGTYYARIVHGGRQHWKTLKTKTLTVARQRLRVEEEKIRKTKPARRGDQMTFGQAAAIYAAQVATERLADSTKEFRLRPSAALRRTWPELVGMDVRRITAQDLAAWQRRFENGDSAYTPRHAKRAVAGNSPTTVNACVAYLRRVFAIAIANGLIASNPAASLSRKPPRKKLLHLPSKEQFRNIVAHIRKQAVRWNTGTAELVEGLAYSGMRLAEATALLWADVDLDRGRIVVNGTKTENSARVVPVNPAMRELLVRLHAHKAGDKVFGVASALGTLAQACESAGIQKLTHHDLRHFFATTCIESGVDIPTVSRWLGHADGGAHAMKTYGHLREQHSTGAAAKVTF